MMTLPPFSLQHVEASDIAAIEAIGEAAMRNDKQTVFKHLAQPAPADQYNGTQPPFANWLASPKCQLLKAVDDATNEILGSVCWAFQGFDAPPARPDVITDEGAGGKRTDPKDETEAEEERPQEPQARCENPVDRLNDFTSSDFVQWMESTMPSGTKCMFICAISVHPRHQGRGIGKKLIRWGTEQADRNGVFCWVHASEAGYPVFVKEGFEVDRSLEIDIDSYAKDVEIETVRERNWGMYTLRYMIRKSVRD